MNSNKPIEKLLQKMRFGVALPHIKGDVLDFGGNKGELEPYLKGKYVCCNKDYSVIKGKKFDTIVMLAVIEHICYVDVPDLLIKLRKHLKPNGRMVITVPTRYSRYILSFLSWIGLLDRENIKEHTYHWWKPNLMDLADECKLKLEKFRYFQLGFNQLVVYKK